MLASSGTLRRAGGSHDCLAVPKSCVFLTASQRDHLIRERQEHIGVLRNVEKSEGMTLLEFDDCYVCFYRDLDIEKYIGKNIGVLRINGEEKEVWIREV